MNKKELKKEVKTWLKEVKDIEIVYMDTDGWIGEDRNHILYSIFVSYCTMVVSIKILSDNIKIDFYDMNNNFRKI